MSSARHVSADHPASVSELMESFRPALIAMLALRIPNALRSRLDPEDILSEAFFIADRRKSQLPSESPEFQFAWLYRIVRDCLIEASRHGARACRDASRNIPWPDDSALHCELGLWETATTPSEAANRKEVQERVNRLLEQLPLADREILLMRHFEQLSHRQIALVLEISEDAVMKRYERSLKRLTELWRDQYDD